MRKKVFARLLALALGLAPYAVSAQQGFLNSGELIANSSATRGPAGPSTATAFLDRAFGSTAARLLVRGAGSWSGVAPSGDLTMSALGAFTLATVNSNVGSFGSASAVPIFTVNAKGLITAASSTPLSGSTVNWTPTGTGGTARTIASTLQERGVTLTDYGAVPNNNTAGVPASNATAVTRAFAASPKVFCKPGENYYVESIVIPTTAMSLSNCTFTAGGSYGAGTAVLSVTSNTAGLVIDGVIVSVDVSTYTTTNGIMLLNTTNATISNSSLSGIYPVYVPGKSVNTRITGNVFASGTFGRGIFATSDGSAARTFTVTSASPGVFTRVAHGLAVNDTVILYTTGGLYTGLTRGRLYYVKTVPTADTFTLALTAGGAAINTSGAQSGTHYFTSNGPAALYIGNNTIYKSATVNSQGIVLIGVSDATITNNVILGSAHFGISSGLGEHNSITDNNVSSSAKEAIHTDSGVNAMISGNMATFDATSGDVGFSVSSDNGPPAVNTQVVGNSIDSPFADCIYLVGASGASVQGNKLRNCNAGGASANSASIILDGTLTTNNMIGPNTIEDTLGFSAYQVGEANYTSGTPSANYIAQQLGKVGTTGYILNVATTNTMVRAQNSPSSIDTVGGFWFGSSAFAKRDTGGSSVYLYDFANTLVGSLTSTNNNWGNTTHIFSGRGYGSVYGTFGATGWNWTNVAAPATPAAGTNAVYTDSTSKRLCNKDDAGVVSCGASAGSWTAYTPTLTCGSGTLTTASATGAFKQDGKTVTFRAVANITTNGTCAGRLDLTLPVAASAGLGTQPLSGFSDTTGAVLSAAIVSSSPTKVSIFSATATYPGGSATSSVAGGTYEVP